MHAIRSTALLGNDRKEAEEAMEGLHESISQVKDLSELLGQSVGVEEVTDEDLEEELTEFTAGNEEYEHSSVQQQQSVHVPSTTESMVASSPSPTSRAVGLRVPLLLGLS